MHSSRWFNVLCVAALACTPKLSGTCASNADCHPGESCSSGGLCLRPGAASGNGDGGAAGDPSDAGDAGPITGATIDILSPVAGAIERGTFHVSAQTASAIAIQDITLYLTNSSSGSAVGQLVVSAPTVNNWSGDLTLNVSSFGGGADLVAVMHRAGLTDVTSAKVNVVVDQNAPSISPSWNPGKWWALDAGISLTAMVSDDRSGVASATLILPDGGTVSGTLGTLTATFQVQPAAVGTPGAALHVPVSLGATDVAGNSTLLSAASTIAVDDQPPSISLVALDPLVWRNGPLDVNANVGDGTGSGVGSSSLLLNAAFRSGTPDGGGGFNYHLDLSTLPATEAAVALQAIGVDNVGNQADAGFSINVDNIPPVMNTAQIDTAFDGTDAANQGWFAGPTAAPSAAAIAVSAAVKDTNLVTTGLRRPAAIVSGTPYYGTFNSITNRWGFSIPRSVGLNANAAVAVSFDAQDLAGNHPASTPSLPLQFDDVPASSFVPGVAADTGWHARTGNLSVGVTFGAAPRSGFASVLIKVTGQTDVTCTPSSALSWLCNLPLTDATTGAEGPFSFPVVAKSVTKIGSGNSGFRNIDDANPVISNANGIIYPTGSWGHDGSSLTLRDNVTYTFTAYDCGSGLSTSLASFGFSPQLGTRSATMTASSSTQACSNGTNATIYNVKVNGDLSTSTPGSFPNSDNTGASALTVSATVPDGVGHTAGSSKGGINITRRLWQTGNLGASALALGPKVVVAEAGQIQGLNPSDGTNAWISSAFPSGALVAGPLVGGSAASPAVFYASGGLTMVEISAQTGLALLANCSLQTGFTYLGCAIPNNSTNDPGTTGQYSNMAIAIASDGSAVFGQTLINHGTNTSGLDCGNGEFWAGTMSASACTKRYSVGPFGNTSGGVNLDNVRTLTIGRAGRTFQADDVYNTLKTTSYSTVEEVTLGSGTVLAGSTCTGLILTDNGGSDSPICNGYFATSSRSAFTGGSPPFSTTWTGGGLASITAPSQGVYLSTAGYSLSNGTLAFNNFAGTAWAVDASSSPVLYWANGAVLSANYFAASGLGATAWGLPPLPGTSISDIMMDKSGILYVASGGQVSAIITDSPGLGTGNNGWPIAGHDACRSSNLEYACPY